MIMYVQLACTLTFEALHNSSCDAGINHPNQYFSDSQKILKEKVNYYGEKMSGLSNWWKQLNFVRIEKGFKLG